MLKPPLKEIIQRLYKVPVILGIIFEVLTMAHMLVVEVVCSMDPPRRIARTSSSDRSNPESPKRLNSAMYFKSY